MNKIKKFFGDPYYVFGNYMMKRCPNLMSDKYFLKVMWKRCMGYELDLDHPKTFNEKLQWLKLYDRKPIYTTMVDKYRAKQWIADRIGEQYVIPTLAVYDSVDEIDLDKLPEKFVLKCNHDCGSVVICKDKSTFDIGMAKKKLGEALKKNYYWNSREWPYKHVKRCVFAEKYLEGLSGEKTPADYKFYTFNGEPKFCYITSDRDSVTGLKEDFFDLNGEVMPFNQVGYNNNVVGPILPVNFEKMIELSRILAKGTYHLRVDFFEIDNEIQSGELTFFDGAGFCPFYPNEWNDIIGDLMKLPIE